MGTAPVFSQMVLISFRVFRNVVLPHAFSRSAKRETLQLRELGLTDSEPVNVHGGQQFWHTGGTQPWGEPLG
jgi:hypothetical protein